ncbi:MAG: penicillin-binding protein 1C [Candidatus Marinimicrobia bacterium]|nr:penicillin-binding protein 1C [Candidatus Neomarinimicrobiota bacterium]
MKPFSIARLISLAGILLLLWLLVPPGELFPDRYSTLVFDQNHELLRFTLAEDDQYRAPYLDKALPEKYIQALITWEDKRFFWHPGIDPVALGRAFLSNLTSGRRVSGGSTIPMQVARLSSPKSRTYFHKFQELFSAVKITLHYSKAEVLQLYASQVPMGGNIVGLNTAAHCYFEKPSSELTWSEACLFALLPNAPSMLNLSKQRPLLLQKRNRLLERLYDQGHMDQATLKLAQAEPLPGTQIKLPFKAPHFSEQVLKLHSGNMVQTTLHMSMQNMVSSISDIHHRNLKTRGIHNLAILVAETSTGAVRAYVGSQNFFDNAFSGQVDGIQATRSTGSLLKPFLVAKALDRGPFTMQSQIQDVPTFFGTFSPQNASKTFSGMVTLDEMLIRSLNIPSVRLLNTIGISDMYEIFKDMGLRGLFRSAEGYGLALILGGAEASLYELVQAYVDLGNMGKPIDLFILPKERESIRERSFSAGACYQVLMTLQNLTRPGSDFYWKNFSYQTPVSWKTGTSYGQKDAWAIGTTPEYTVGVWVGNFDGEGNVELGGAQSAGPVLFDVINAISDPSGVAPFEKPEMGLRFIEICKQSGYPPNSDCPDRVMAEVPMGSHQSGLCPYHKSFIVEAKTGEALCSQCWTRLEREKKVLYVEPPAVQKVLRSIGHSFIVPPMHRADCEAIRSTEELKIIYPIHNVRVFVPRNFDGSYESIVLEAIHPMSNAHLFWLLDQELLGETDSLHTLAVDLSAGEHFLTIMDEQGMSKTIRFEAFRN